ncbi:MAG: mannitol dehydrogenase family protein [Candidatus Nanopelagicales bacterium]|nr:mannitol dehydrogenase family protein [Candidatus Nanopelagicales bacterium]
MAAVPDDVSIPEYDRRELKSGIVHIGVGNFHRAHQALVIDRLLRIGAGQEWGICGVAALPSDEPLVRSLQSQDCLYTLVEKDASGRWDSRVIGSITQVLLVSDDPQAVVDKLADPDVRIVSLTITEGGYNINPETGEFMLNTPAVLSDLARTTPPTTVFGLVCAALERRRDSGIPPFTILSCDNIQHNGDVARAMFTAFAEEYNPELAIWMTYTVAFPNSMVDRITPVTTQADRETVSEHIGVRDECPVLCEPFFQWVVEDDFSSGRPSWEEAGVQVTDNVAPYEKMKLRLLNASHQGLAYFALLMGYQYVHDAAQDPLIATFLRRYMDEEATPTLDSLPGVDLEHYKSDLIERFANPEVKDTVARLAAESSDRIPKWLLPVVRDRLDQGGDVRLSAAIVASWARYAEAIDEDGRDIDVVDPLRDELIPIARRQDDYRTAFIENRALFGDLVDHHEFRDPYVETLSHLKSNGARATLAWILGHS